MSDKLWWLRDLVVVAVAIAMSVMVLMVFMEYSEPILTEIITVITSQIYNIQPVCVRTPSCHAACDNSHFVDFELMEWELLDFNEFPQNNFTCECVYRNCVASPITTFITEGNIKQTCYDCTNEIRLRVFSVRRDCHGRGI